MKSFAVVLALLVATSNAFSPLLATRAVGKPAVAKKPVATVAVKKAAPKPVAKKAAPAPKVVAKVAPNFFAKKAAPAPKVVAKVAPKPVVKKPAPAPKVVAKVAPKPVAKKAAPMPVAKKAAPKPVVKKAAAPAKPLFDGLANFKIKAPPKPKISIQGPKTTRVKNTVQYAYDDGLTELERKQRKLLPGFLTGSAKSQADLTAIRKDLVEKDDEFYFSPYDTTLAAVGAFAIISLIIKAGSP